jgi:hypothetical protein
VTRGQQKMKDRLSIEEFIELTTDRSGVKDDREKAMMSVVFRDFARALEAVGDVGTYGVRKYAAHGWETVPDRERRYMDAMIRHMLAHLRGEKQDAESGLDHLAHMAWNALCVLELEQRKGDES